MVKSAQNNPALTRLSGVFKHILAEHGEAFAHVKRLGMRLESRHGQREHGLCHGGGGCVQRANEPVSRGGERGEMAEGYAALRAIVHAEQMLEHDTRPSDLADAMAALDAINPESPEWGPTFLQVSELVEAHLREADGSCSTFDEEGRRLVAAS